MKNPFDVLVRVTSAGGWLRMVDGELRMALPADCPPDFKDTIRQHKPALVKLMRRTFLLVSSRVLNDAVVLFVPDDATKDSLVTAGADRNAIYTRDELSALVARKVTPQELRLIHEAKRRFNAKLTPN
jgi:hypothetical protein